MSFLQEVEVVVNKLDDFSFTQANSAFETLTASGPVHSRIKAFYWAKFLVRQGQFSQAIEHLIQTEENFGSNVSLKAELVGAYYLQGDIFHFEQALAELESNYIDVVGLLSEESKLRTQVALGKFFEESGEVSKALNYYKRCIDGYDHKAGLSEHLYRVLAQVLRLECEFGSVKLSKQYFSWLNHLSNENYRHNFNVEVFHSMVISESKLVSPELAWQRFLDFSSSIDLLPLDYDLILSDLIYEFLKVNFKWSSSMSSKIWSWEPSGEDNRWLARLVGNSYEVTFADLQQIKKMELSVAQGLRLRHILLLKSSQLLDLASAVRSEINMTLSSLSNESQKFWKNVLIQEAQSSNPVLEFDRESKVVRHLNLEVKLKNRAIACEIILMLGEKPKVANELVTQKIWPYSEFDESFFHRLRMQIKRLNKSIYDITSIKDAIEINQQQIQLNPGLSIKVKN